MPNDDRTPIAHGTAVVGTDRRRREQWRGRRRRRLGIDLTSVDMLDPDSPVYLYSADLRPMSTPPSTRWRISTSPTIAGISLSSPYLHAPTLWHWWFAGINVEYGYASANGRGGLGTVIVQGVGNDNIDAQGNGLNTSRFTITRRRHAAGRLRRRLFELRRLRSGYRSRDEHRHDGSHRRAGGLGRLCRRADNAASRRTA